VSIEEHIELLFKNAFLKPHIEYINEYRPEECALTADDGLFESFIQSLDNRDILPEESHYFTKTRESTYPNPKETKRKFNIFRDFCDQSLIIYEHIFYKYIIVQFFWPKVFRYCHEMSLVASSLHVSSAEFFRKSNTSTPLAELASTRTPILTPVTPPILTPVTPPILTPVTPPILTAFEIVFSESTSIAKKNNRHPSSDRHSIRTACISTIRPY
jgi:hypothetical protein